MSNCSLPLYGTVFPNQMSKIFRSILGNLEKVFRDNVEEQEEFKFVLKKKEIGAGFGLLLIQVT